MKFEFYSYAVSLSLDELSDIFGYNLARFGDFVTYWQKINVQEISSPEPVILKGSEIFQNVPEPLAKL